jgi:DNA polymerase-3 subunit alpha
MAALMSIESASTSQNRDEKILVAVDTCKKMGIKILPPDINFSGRDFEIEIEKTSLQGLAIRFGFTGIKGLGVAAIDQIMSARARVGKFQSFTHFLLETEKTKVNKKTLEALIKVGAFADFANRATLLENLAKIREQLGKNNVMEGQDNLFATVETPTITDNFVALEEYSQAELLSFEKELLGFYLTAHPMAGALETAQMQATKKIGDLILETDRGNTYIFGGLIARFRQVTTKRGETMGFGQLEDGTGSLEFVVFPKSYAQSANVFQVDKVAVMRAKVEQREGNINLVVERAYEPSQNIISQVQLDTAHKIFIPRTTKKEVLGAIGELLKATTGEDKVLIAISTPTGIENKLLPYTVAWSEELQEKIQELLKQ